MVTNNLSRIIEFENYIQPDARPRGHWAVPLEAEGSNDSLLAFVPEASFGKLRNRNVKLLNVKSALIGTQAARALVLLQKEGVHLIHGQAAVVTELDVEVALLLGLDLGEDGA